MMMNFMEMTIVKLVEAGLRDGVKVLVGGAPVSQRFAESRSTYSRSAAASWT